MTGCRPHAVCRHCPRPALVGNATEDESSYPLSEMLSCIAASSVFPRRIISFSRMSTEADAYLEDCVGYDLRKGKHYFARDGWGRPIRFVNLHR